MGADPSPETFRTIPDVEAQRLLRLSKRRLVQRCRRIAERCLDLTPAEVAFRVSALFAQREAAPPPVACASDSTASPERVVEALHERFVLGPRDVGAITDALARRPDTRARVIDEARRLTTEGARIFDRVVPLPDAGGDWQKDPCTGERLWPETTLDEGDAVRATRTAEGRVLTDVKYVWELNRQQFLLPLALAGRLTGDETLAERARGFVDHWIAQNPPGRGVNWSSVLEVGVRAISWLWALPFLIASPDADRARTRRWLASLRDHYDFLRGHLSVFTDRSNHLIGEATALWLLASVIPDLPDAETEAARALDVLAVEIERQVTADGVTCEQAIGYHCFVLDFYLQILMVARRQGRDLPAVVESRLAAMLRFLRRVLGPGGALPSIGDGDDGMGWPTPHQMTARERAALLVSAGTRLLALPRHVATRSPSLLVDLLADRRLEPPSDAGTADDESVLFPDGGYCFLEATTPAGGHRQLVFDVGGLGYLPNAAHEHADALSILVRVGQTLVLGDPGTGTYTASRSVRDAFRATASHNTVTIDDLDQADVLDTFKWINCFRTSVLAADFDERLDHVAAAHEGFDRMRDRMRHGREILFVKPDYWIVVDHVTGRGRHGIARRFHFPPGFIVAPHGADTFDVTNPDVADGLRFAFPAIAGEPTTATVEPGPWSTGYNQWGTSSRLVVRNHLDARGLFLTLITPLQHGQASVSVDHPEPAAWGAGDRVEHVVCRIRLQAGPVDREDAILQGRAGALTFVSRSASGEITRTLGGATRSRT